MLYTPEVRQRLIERFPKIVLATEYAIEDDCIKVPEDGYENIYNIKSYGSTPKCLVVDKIGEKRQEYLTGDLDQEILIALLNKQLEGIGFLPAFKERQLVDKLNNIKGILPDWRKQMLISNEKRYLATSQTVAYVTNRLSNILEQKLETRKLKVEIPIQVAPQSLQRHL